MRLAFVTNNASRAPEVVAAHLTALGIAAEAADVVTSGQAAARVVAARVPAGSAVLVVGTDALADQLHAAGLRPVRTVADAGDGGPAAVVQGLSPDTTWRDLAEAAAAVHAGALWVVGNVDATLPTPRGPLPGNGTMVDAVRTATGAQPLVAGKPEPALHEESVQRVGARHPLVVGDRLDTDVAGAVRAGADSLLVLTGVVGVLELVRAPAGMRPSYVAPDLRGLFVAHPPVRVDGAAAVCGDACARVQDGVATLERPADAADAAADDDAAVARQLAALRALCAAAWSAADAGRDVRTVEGWPAGG
jgi:HAD superfamily hydrolase (TIGR01450 family)